jgi:hypothetical protein
MTVGDLVRVLSGFPQDKLVHVDLADNDGNVWRGDVDGFPVVDEDGCWLQAGLVHHQTPEETLEMASDDVEDDVEEED